MHCYHHIMSCENGGEERERCTVPYRLLYFFVCVDRYIYLNMYFLYPTGIMFFLFLFFGGAGCLFVSNLSHS